MSVQLLTNFRWWRTGELSSMSVEENRVVLAPNMHSFEHQSGYELVDCGGKILLPKFIDSHCHVLPTGLDLLKLDLSSFGTRQEVLDAVRDWSHAGNGSSEGWILAVQYNQTKFHDSRHITIQELDALSNRPILIRHSNGHASVANSAALQAAGVSDSTPNPAGGEYGRDASGSLNGVLFETAHEYVTSCAPQPGLNEMVEAILAAGVKMAELGIGTASDMMTGRFDLGLELQAYQIAAERGCPIRTRLYVQWREVFGPKGVGLEAFRDLEAGFTNSNRTKVAGVKLFADGAIGSATAAIYGQYTGAESNGVVISPFAKPTEAMNTSGQLIYSAEKLKKMVMTATEAGYQVAVHSIGDYSTDLVLDAFEATGCASRHRLEHAMLLSDSQIERLAQLNPFVTFQPEFLLRFGGTYLKQLGSERTSLLKRSRSVIDAGLRLSFSSDRPIVPGDPRDGIRFAIERGEGFVSAENISFEEAVDAYTVQGAMVNGDLGLMGTLGEGELADYQLVDSVI